MYNKYAFDDNGNRSKKVSNLNDLQIGYKREFSSNLYKDNSCSSSEITVYFRNLKEKLITHIQEADMVLGAVAWLTDNEILDALAKVQNVSIVVQKEDFLRPDIGNNNDFKRELREKYDKLKCYIDHNEFEGNVFQEVYYYDCLAVRCVGNYNKDKKPAFPRMHNKFVVFAKTTIEEYENKWIGINAEGEEVENTDRGKYRKIIPYAVWTGSFNFTRNATFSLENALYITNTEIANAYFQEFGQILSISENLDWETDWANPEWRLEG